MNAIDEVRLIKEGKRKSAYPEREGIWNQQDGLMIKGNIFNEVRKKWQQNQQKEQKKHREETIT